ncbi:hypothetical protein Ahy_B02g061102 [Arachis hypogaea]|uniref:Uncharacterized protein n=1 Tax=Arachis hypogaea TaxID=3818 RepID=A0A445AK84_ARAHY|nr:hypothetical protein Ahy_B02g061102 [Arachis hypogaea]
MSVREAMERPLNGSKIILRFNEELQAIDDEASLLSGILGVLGFDYSKFPICEKSWAKVQGKDRVYNDCIKAKCKQNTLNRKKKLYTHTGGSKSLVMARKEESQKQGRRVGKGEVWILKHKRPDGTYIHEEAQRISEEATAEKLKRKVMEDEVAAEKTKRQAIESVLSYLVQQQGEELRPDITARMNSLDGHGGK